MKAEFLKIAGVSSEAEFYKKYPTEDSFFTAHPNAKSVLAAGGSIHIDPSKKGTFKAQASKMGMSVSAAASKILAAKEGTYSPAMRKKANFAKNFAHANGGPIMYQNGGQLTEFENGGTHEENPNGGVPQGPTAMVEQGETKMDAANYVFSDRLKVPKDLAMHLQMPFIKDKTFAQASKAIRNKYDPQGKRHTDAIVQRAIERELKKLIAIQEVHKAEMVMEHQQAINELTGGQGGAPESPDSPNSNIPQGQPMMAYGGKVMMQYGSSLDPYLNPYLDPNDPMLSGTPSEDTGLGAAGPSLMGHERNIHFNPAVGTEDFITPGTLAEDATPMGNTEVPATGGQPLGTTVSKSSKPGGASGFTGLPLNGEVPMSDVLATTAQLGTLAANMGTARQLKKMKPEPKDIKMFDMGKEFTPEMVDVEPYMSDITAQGAEAYNQIGEIAGGSAGTALANIGSTADKLARTKTAVRANIEQENERRREAAFQMNLQSGNMDMARRMQVQDWNDADINAFQEALLNLRGAQAENMATIGMSQSRLQGARDLQSGTVKTVSFKNFKKRK